jgi:hypothetical protein
VELLVLPSLWLFDPVFAGGGHASLASEQQYLFLSHRGDKPLLVGQYVVVIQADMGQPLVSVEVRFDAHSYYLQRYQHCCSTI